METMGEQCHLVHEIAAFSRMGSQGEVIAFTTVTTIEVGVH